MKKDKSIPKIIIPETGITDKLVFEVISNMFVDSVLLIQLEDLHKSKFVFYPSFLPEL